MILLRHLKAGFEKRANRRLRMGLLPHMRIGGCKLLLSSRGKVPNNAGEVVVAGWLAQLKSEVPLLTVQSRRQIKPYI